MTLLDKISDKIQEYTSNAIARLNVKMVVSVKWQKMLAQSSTDLSISKHLNIMLSYTCKNLIRKCM